MRIRREKTLAIFVGVSMILTLCMVGFATTADASGYVYVDAPTGDPLLDHAAIQGAVDSMRPGDTVVLASGTYKIHKGIVTDGFRGAIVGAGMDDTVIQAVPKPGEDGYFEAVHYPAYDTPYTQDYYTAFFMFGRPDKKLVLADLAMEVYGAFAEDSYTIDTESMVEYYWGLGPQIGSAVDVSFAQGCDTTFENVRVTGYDMPDNAGSPRNGISIWYSNGGKHTLTGCVLENIGTFSYGPYGCSNAKFVVGSCEFNNGFRGWQSVLCTGLNVKITGSTFTDLPNAPAVANWALGSSHFMVSGNTFMNVRGATWAYSWSGNPVVGSSFIYQQNDIVMTHWGDFAGIEVWDGSEAKSHFVVVQNTIHHEDMIAPYGGICLNGVHDGVVANNKITGYGPAAMFIAAWTPDDDLEGVKIINNDVQGFEVTAGLWHDYDTGDVLDIGPIAHYYLGPYSSYCTLVLGNSLDTYVDAGMYNMVVERG